MDCGVRSSFRKCRIAGIAASGISAAITHSQRQSITVISATKVTGITASPNEKPSAAIAIALPRVATNHRAMATKAICAIIPCPRNRSRKIVSTSVQTAGENAIARQARTSSASMNGPSPRTRNLSVSVPAHSITAADAMVDTA